MAGASWHRLRLADDDESYATAAERRRAARHGAWKGRIYAESGAPLFVESSLHQAQRIAAEAKRPVLCVETMTLL